MPTDAALDPEPDAFFPRRDGALHAEGVPMAALASAHGTPLYVYSRAALTAHYRAFTDALAGVSHRVHYAVKANSNLAVLGVLARLGAGFDIVSGGELFRVLRAGGDATKVVFSGVGKTADELAAALAAGIACFNVESEAELHRLHAVAKAHGARARIALRVNPDVDARTHPYIATGLKESKFGVSLAQGLRLYQDAAALPHLEITGIASHIGSQLLEASPLVEALDRMLDLVAALDAKGIAVEHVDVGGGLGVRYREGEQTLAPAAWAALLLPRLAAFPRPLALHCEPGRAIAANAGVLLTRVELVKQAEAKRFCVVDAAMNDLLRPTLYEAWMDVIPVQATADAETEVCDVVGPVCESGDWLARDRALAVAEGDLLAIRGAGAYGFTMSSNYNTRPRAAEVLVDGAEVHVARTRESLEDLVRGEAVLPDPAKP